MEKVVEATVKMDGMMVHGVLVDGGWELWTKGGHSAVGKAAMRFARGSTGDVGPGVPGLVGLLEEVEEMSVDREVVR